MKKLAIILIWTSIGVSSSYMYHVKYRDKPFHTHLVISSVITGPTVTLGTGIIYLLEQLHDCLANCKDG